MHESFELSPIVSSTIWICLYLGYHAQMHLLDLDNFLVVACTQGDEEHKHEYYFKVVASIFQNFGSFRYSQIGLNKLGYVEWSSLCVELIGLAFQSGFIINITNNVIGFFIFYFLFLCFFLFKKKLKFLSFFVCVRACVWRQSSINQCQTWLKKS